MWTGGCCTAPSQISFGMWNPTILSLFKYGLLSHSLLGQVPPNGMVSMGIAVSYHLPSGYNLKLLKIIDPKLWMIFFSSRPHVQVIFGPQWIQWDGIPHFWQGRWQSATSRWPGPHSHPKIPWLMPVILTTIFGSSF